MRCEVILNDEQSKTARMLLTALIDSAPDGVSITVTESYQGTEPYLVLWGVGRAEFMEARRRHLAGGGRVIMWDMGYLGRA